MPTSFAMAVLADLGWARMEVMKPSDNMMESSQRLTIDLREKSAIAMGLYCFEWSHFARGEKKKI